MRRPPTISGSACSDWDRRSKGVSQKLSPRNLSKVAAQSNTRKSSSEIGYDNLSVLVKCKFCNFLKGPKKTTSPRRNPGVRVSGWGKCSFAGTILVSPSCPRSFSSPQTGPKSPNIHLNSLEILQQGPSSLWGLPQAQMPRTSQSQQPSNYSSGAERCIKIAHLLLGR